MASRHGRCGGGGGQDTGGAGEGAVFGKKYTSCIPVLTNDLHLIYHPLMNALKKRKIERKNGGKFLYESIAATIRSSIESGEYGVGSRLPSLDDFSSHFGANRLTVRKALTILREEGYIYSLPAQGTYVRQATAERKQEGTGAGQRKIRVVGLLSQVLVPAHFGPYHQEIIAGINEALLEYGANLLTYAVGLIRPDQLIHVRDAVPADAMIYMGPFDRVILSQLVRSGPPSVLVDFDSRGLPCDSICLDNELGGMEVGRLLAANGLSDDFAIIAGRPDDACAARMEGIRKSLEQETGSYHPRVIANGNYTKKGGRMAMQQIFDEMHPLPKAIFCLNDEMAIGAMDLLLEKGIRVPEDVRIIGFDGIEQGAITRPRLSTVSIDMRQIGRLSVSTLFRRLSNPRVSASRLLISPKLLLRDSF